MYDDATSDTMNTLKVLMFSTDRSLFDHDSEVRKRLLEQSSVVGVLHVIVFTPRGEKWKPLLLGKHLMVHPTCSLGKWSYLSDAFMLARDIIRKGGHTQKWLITTQDPFEIGALGYLVARIYAIPLHLQIHTDPWSPSWKEEHTLNRLRFAVMQFLLHRASGIRVVSKRVYDCVVAEGVDTARVTRVPIFTDVAYWKDTPATFDLHSSYKMFKKIILSIGRLQPEKNYHGLVRAFLRVRRVHDDTMLLIVGSGPERERILLLAHSLGLSDSVIVLPWARNVVSYYKTSDVYVQPSLYEGWGLAVVEAMASGLPTVITDVGVAGELVEDKETGLVVPVGNEDALVDALSELLTNDILRKKLKACALLRVDTLLSHGETIEAYKQSWHKAYTLWHHEHQKTKKR